MRNMLVVGILVVCARGAWAITPKCRALDANDGALILEVANGSATKCTATLATAMKKKRCAKAARGTKVEYMTQYDHKGVKGSLTSVTCGVAAPVATPTCRAVDVKTKETIAEVANKSSTRCKALLATAVKKKRCTAGRGGKKVAYRTQYEQKGAKGKVTTLTCRK